MASYDKPILTTQGISALNQVNAGKAKITYTKVIFSSDDYNSKSDEDIQNMSSISNQEIVTTPVTYDSDTGVKVRAIGENSQLNNAYYINCYATFAKLDNGNEFLFCISLSQTADYMPAFDKVNSNYLLYSFEFSVSESANIALTDSSQVFLTKDDLDKSLPKNLITTDQINTFGFAKQNDLDILKSSINQNIQDAENNSNSYTDKQIQAINQLVQNKCNQVLAQANNFIRDAVQWRGSSDPNGDSIKDPFPHNYYQQ